MVAAERVAQRSLPIPARGVLDEDPEASERPHETGHRQAICMRGVGQFLNAFGAAGDKIGKIQLGGNMDRLHRDCSWPENLHHLRRWRNWLCLRLWIAHLSLLRLLSRMERGRKAREGAGGPS